MKKLRFLTAFIVICSLTLTFAQATAPSPKIVFASDNNTAEDADVAESSGNQQQLVEYADESEDKTEDAWYSAIEGFFTMNSLFETAASPAPAEEDKNIRTVFIEDTTFVALRDFVSHHCPDAVFGYDSGKVTVSAGDDYMEFTEGAVYYYVNGRIRPLQRPCFETGGTFYVPLRSLADIYSYDVAWNETASTATLFENGKEFLSGEEFYDYDDYMLLAKLIRAEGGNQPMEGKVAIGNVVMNRVRHPSFPDSIHEVIYDRSCGVQFSTAYNGGLRKTPTDECLIAAKLCLEGYSVTDESLYFFNPSISTSTWIQRNKDFVTRIGDHVFYS